MLAVAGKNAYDLMPEIRPGYVPYVSDEEKKHERIRQWALKELEAQKLDRKMRSEL